MPFFNKIPTLKVRSVNLYATSQLIFPNRGEGKGDAQELPLQHLKFPFVPLVAYLVRQFVVCLWLGSAAPNEPWQQALASIWLFNASYTGANYDLLRRNLGTQNTLYHT